jgi:hypothetical protein
MTNPIDHDLVATANERTAKYQAKQALQNRTDDDFNFAKIDEYVPSEAVKSQLRRLANIQRNENKTVFDSKVRF